MPSNRDDATSAPEHDWSRHALDGRIALESVEPNTLQSAVRHLLAAGVLLFVLGLLSLLPGLDRAVPRTPLTAFAVVVAAVTLGLVRLLVAAAGDGEALVRQALDGPTELRVTAGVVVKHLFVLAAVLVAYRGLAGVFVPLLAPTDTVWLYDLAFLVLALVPTSFVAYYLLRALDPSASYLTRRVLATGDVAGPGRETGESTDEPTDQRAADGTDEHDA